MRKIALKNLNLKEVEQLSREQLKGVLGGYTGGTGDEEGGTTSHNNHYDACKCDCINGGALSWYKSMNECVPGASKNCNVTNPDFENEGPYLCEVVQVFRQ